MELGELGWGSGSSELMELGEVDWGTGSTGLSVTTPSPAGASLGAEMPISDTFLSHISGSFPAPWVPILIPAPPSHICQQCVELNAGISNSGNKTKYSKNIDFFVVVYQIPKIHPLTSSV